MGELRGLVRLAWVIVLVPALLAVVTVARLLVVSDYRTPTATVLAGATGVAGTVTGAVLPVLGTVLPVAVVALLVAFVVALVLGSRRRTGLLVAATVTALVTLFVSPSAVGIDEAVRTVRDPGNDAVAVLSWADWFPIGLALTVLVAAGLMRRDTMPGFRLGRFLLLAVSGTAVVAVFVLVAQEAYRPIERITTLPETAAGVWLPAERIVATGQPARIGYVLNSDGGWTTVMWEADRTVAVLPPGGVAGRSVCRVGPPDDPPLLSTVERALPVAACPGAPAGR